MRPPMAALGLSCLLVAPLAAVAQDAPRVATTRAARSMVPDPMNPTGTNRAKTDANVQPAGVSIPEPTSMENLAPATIVLPTDPIEPYLLTKQNGPFMVMARTFRGPEADRYALALVKELRSEYQLPAYILRTKDFPLRSMIRNVPPTAPAYINKSIVQQPEKTRNYDEAAVLVGNEKTLADSNALLCKVRKIKPKCLEQMPKVLWWREGLLSAQRTTNPYVPAQDLFPGRPTRDRLLVQMNGGQRSVYNCPGRYTLQVAEFNGRSLYNPAQNDPRLQGNAWLTKSPLVTAADDAEKLAEAVAKDPEIKRTGAPTYVYHDRTSSKVMIGSFSNPNDPQAQQLHDTLIKRAVEMTNKNGGVMIAPANTLTDLEDPTHPIK